MIKLNCMKYVKNISLAFFAWIALLSISACHPSTHDDAATEADKDPMRVTTTFLLNLKNQQLDQAKAMLASWENVPALAMAEAVEDLNDYAKHLGSGRSLLIPVEAYALNNAAIVAVDERRGSIPERPSDIDPIFLIYQEDQWRVFPEPTRFDKWPVLTAEEQADFKALDAWLDDNKKRLLKKSAQVDVSPWLVQP